jgi:mannose-1-phosphate guanylyltransferase
LEVAVQFLAEGVYSWNSGMFIYKAGQVLNEYKRQQPEMYALLQAIQAAIGDKTYPDILAQTWPKMPRLSIDYAIMEKAEKMVVIPVDIGWSDIGSWATLFDVLEGDHDGNVIRGRASEAHVNLDTKNTLIFSDRPIATIGLEDVVIVDTEDVLLVCHRERSQDVRTVIDRLKGNGKEELL